MTRTFDGKVAVVTGAGSGMGKAAAQAFARAGASVVVADVNAPAGEQVASELRQAGGEALFIKTDVSKAADVKAMVDGAVEAFGGLHCAFNNAGVGGHMGFIHEYPEEWFDLMVDVNLKGVFLCLKYEIAYMLEHGGGAIVNNSSSEGLRGAMPFAAYIGAKHGVVGLTKAAALETARHGIRGQRDLSGRDENTDARGGRGQPRRVRREEQGTYGDGQARTARRDGGSGPLAVLGRGIVRDRHDAVDRRREDRRLARVTRHSPLKDVAA